jgi:hypothetical protein
MGWGWGFRIAYGLGRGIKKYQAIKNAYQV